MFCYVSDNFFWNIPFLLITSRLSLEILKSIAVCVCKYDDLPDLLFRGLRRPSARWPIPWTGCQFLNVNFCDIVVRKKNILFEVSFECLRSFKKYSVGTVSKANWSLYWRVQSEDRERCAAGSVRRIAVGNSR